MAFNETFSTTTGRTLYGQIWRRGDGQIWSVAGGAFEPYLDAHWANYAVAMPEQGTSGVYLLTSPAGVGTATVYDVLVFAQAGGTPAKSDAPAIGTGTIGPQVDSVSGGTTNNFTGSLAVTPMQTIKAGGPIQTKKLYAKLNGTMAPLLFQAIGINGAAGVFVGPVKFRLFVIGSMTPGNETLVDTITATLSVGNTLATVQVPKTDNAAITVYGWTLWDTGAGDQPLYEGTYDISAAGPAP